MLKHFIELREIAESGDTSLLSNINVKKYESVQLYCLNCLTDLMYESN